MKKWKIIIILIILLIVIGIIMYLSISGYGSKLYRYYNYNDVLDYGDELSIYQILGNNIDISEYPKLGRYKYKKANVRSYGSTAHVNINIGNNKIIFIGNRNLVEINNTLYVYNE